MSAEKMAILKMLEEGKITADNAAKLLASIDSGGDGKTDSASGRAYGSQTPPREGRGGSPGGADRTWGRELGRKIEVAAKDLEPKIQKLTEVVIDKSVEIADAATRSINAARERRGDRERAGEVRTGQAYSEPRPARASSVNASSSMEKTFELFVSSGSPNELILKTVKGSVGIRGYNGDKATLNVTYKKRGAGAELEFLKLGCVYQFSCDSDAVEIVRAEAFVPYSMFTRICVETSDGNVDADGVSTQKMLINTSGCHISLKNVQADELKIDNVNGQVLLSGLSGGSLSVENANGQVDAVNTDFRSLKLETTAEAVSIISQGFYKHNDYNWRIATSNARVKASLPVAMDTAYEIKAYTSLSDVSNGLSGLSYTRNDRNCIEGKSDNYDSCARKVRIEMETSNAPLFIN